MAGPAYRLRRPNWALRGRATIAPSTLGQVRGARFLRRATRTGGNEPRRAPPQMRSPLKYDCQGEGRAFESPRPLQISKEKQTDRNPPSTPGWLFRRIGVGLGHSWRPLPKLEGVGNCWKPPPATPARQAIFPTPTISTSMQPSVAGSCHGRANVKLVGCETRRRVLGMQGRDEYRRAVHPCSRHPSTWRKMIG